jgi:hypothetical protein
MDKDAGDRLMVRLYPEKDVQESKENFAATLYNRTVALPLAQ